MLRNQSSLRCAALFFQAWREDDSPLRSEGELVGSQATIGTVAMRRELPCLCEEVDRDFCSA